MPPGPADSSARPDGGGAQGHHPPPLFPVPTGLGEGWGGGLLADVQWVDVHKWDRNQVPATPQDSVAGPEPLGLSQL